MGAEGAIERRVEGELWGRVMRQAISRTGVRLILLGMLAGGLAACGSSEPDLNWSAPVPGKGSAIAQCYRTLAEPDCSTTLLPNQESRAVGWFDDGRPSGMPPATRTQ